MKTGQNTVGSMTLQSNIPAFYCYVRKQFIYNNEKFLEGEVEECFVVSLRSVAGRAVSFTILTRRGAMFTQIPIHALVSKEKYEKVELHNLELWDCFSENVSVLAIEPLVGMRCGYKDREGKLRYGKYMFTVDWFNNSYSDEPGQLKQAHFISLDCGMYAAQANNRMVWIDPSFTDKKHYFFDDKADYPITNEYVYSAESEGSMWHVEHKKQFYGVQEPQYLDSLTIFNTCKDVPEEFKGKKGNENICLLCNGTGKREFPNTTPPIIEQCPACRGTGKPPIAGDIEGVQGTNGPTCHI